jgi:hypothetical protein
MAKRYLIAGHCKATDVVEQKSCKERGGICVIGTPNGMKTYCPYFDWHMVQIG